jgi:tripartite-type tricarboxylate transporter receptor subunit TctC
MQRREALMMFGAIGAAGLARAQEFPAKTVRLISPFAAGGGSDFLARYLAQKLAPSLGQSVIVENKVGAGGMLGTDFVAKAPPDGHTVLIGSNGPLAVSAALGAKLPYDPVKDLIPVSLLTRQPFVLLTSASSQIKDFGDFIRLAKASPGKLSYGTPGTGSAPHLAIEMIKMMAKVFVIHVPYRGGPPAITDLIAGQIDLATSDPNTAMPMLKQGRLRALAVTTARRSPMLPDVPTVAESGITGYDVAGWFGALVPAGTPRPAVDRLHTEFAKALGAPETRDALASLGGEVIGSSPEKFRDFIASETQNWRQLVKTMNIKPES